MDFFKKILVRPFSVDRYRREKSRLRGLHSLVGAECGAQLFFRGAGMRSNGSKLEHG